MKRILAITMTASLALSVVGCSTEPDLAVCTNVEPWQAYSACVHAQYARQEQANENAATMLLLGGTAIMNGWNTRYQRPTITCMTSGSMTTCN
jgi:hypothetical protein